MSLSFRSIALLLTTALAFAYGAPAMAALTVNGDGTVTDTTTGLVWDRCAYGLTGANCATGTAQTPDWPNALKTATAANTAAYKGFTDWRLPNKNELESIVKIDTGEPTIDSTAFPNTPFVCPLVCGGSSFWSSTSYAPNPSNAWNVDFDSGRFSLISTAGASHVRLVRSGQPLAAFDVLAPTPTLSSTSATSPSASGVTLNATSSVNGTGYWLVVPAGSAAPTAAQIKAGSNYAGVVVAAAGNASMTTATAKAFGVSGLAAQTAYAAYLIVEDAAPTASAVSGPVSFNTLAPALTPTPTLSSTSATSPSAAGVTLNATSNVNGTGYWLVVPTGSAAPTEAQIKAGSNYAGVVVAAAGNASMTTATAKAFGVSGLAAQTAYAAYLIVEDATPTASAVSGPLSFNTLGRSTTGPTATGSGTGSVSFTTPNGNAGCGFASTAWVAVTSKAPSLPPGVNFPHGLFRFDTNNCGNGTTLNITVTLPSAVPAGTPYYKYGKTPTDPTLHWYTLPATLNGAGTQYTFSITDGGLGDDDLTVNGVISDDGGPGVGYGTGEVNGIPTLSEWALLLLAGLMGWLGMQAARAKERH